MKTTQVGLADFAKDAGRVQAFCDDKGLADYPLLAVKLVKDCFKLVGQPSLSVDINDETGEEFLLLEFTAQGGVEPVLADYQRLISRWVQAVPWPQALMISFCYSITK